MMVLAQITIRWSSKWVTVFPSAHLLLGVSFFLWFHRLSVDSSRSSPHRSPSWLSTVCSCLSCSMLFCKLNYDAAAKELTPPELWWVSDSFLYLAVQIFATKREMEAPDCAVCVCAAGLVCMKSSTSVVELVMLLCSQVGTSFPFPCCFHIHFLCLIRLCYFIPELITVNIWTPCDFASFPT